jgi:Golgi nucleoside diphosphatase
MLLQHLIICAGIVIFYKLFLQDRFPLVNKHNEACKHDFFLLKRSIMFSPHNADLTKYEDEVYMFFDKYVGKATDTMLKDLTGDLHAAINNRSTALRQFYHSVN